MHRLIRFLLRWLGALPLPVLHGLATLSFAITFYVVRYRRALIEGNLARAFPDWTPEQCRQVGREHVRGLIDVSLESLYGARIDPEELCRRVVFKNLELLAHYEDQPFIIVSAHQGNWEWQSLALSHLLQIPVEAIYAPSPSAAVEEHLLATRSRFGTLMIPREQTMVEIAKRLKQPRAILMLSDQNPRRDVERCWLEFLNQDTAFAVGLDKLARLTRYPIVFQESRRIRRGHYEVEFHGLAEPPYVKEGSDLLLRYAQMLEHSIQQNPSDWLWSYERWRYPKPLYV